MNSLFIALMFIAMLATLAVMGIGLFSMVKGGEFNEKYGNKLMQLRVIMQGAALFFLVLAFMASQSSS